MSPHVGALLGCLVVCMAPPALGSAADPCLENEPRALVLGGGGNKGAFQAGAAYHLIVHRGCDFVEIAGTSSGALNGTLLAQAEAIDDPAQSIESLRREAEALVDLWTSFRRTRDAARSRPLAILRVGLFGLDSMKNFDALRRLVSDKVALERLAEGRELRVGTLSVYDGRYREVVINPRGQVDPQTALDYVFGSAMVPIYGRMPSIPENAAQPREEWGQFGDGGIRHSTPVVGYFRTCAVPSGGESARACEPLAGDNTPPHGRIAQLFVIVTSPYSRQTDFRPAVDPRSYARNTRRITNGRRILVRTFDLLNDTVFRDDLDDMLTFNDLLRWREQQSSAASAPPATFPIESYHHPIDAPDSPSLPYTIGIVMPRREDTDPTTMFELRPATIRRQLYCGCVAADAMLQAEFGAHPMAESCATRFPPLPERRRGRAHEWDAEVCRDPRTEARPSTRARGAQ